MPPPKTCAVCGDKALGCNFNAVTCESCKAFFRRNALAKKEFSCPFNQNCEITVITRRFCQKCRLKKCVDIGMKSENIMSEEDKMAKRRKIENNRAKRRKNENNKSTENVGGGSIRKGINDGEPQSESAITRGSYESFSGNCDSHSCSSFESNLAVSTGEPIPLSIKVQHLGDSWNDINPEMMTGEEMVEFIVADSDRASQAISKIMRTPTEALATLEKIINSQKDALRLISHLISYPGDALKIISKIMNSPFNALTVFTKFMSSPTDALEIISKVVSSPQEVLKFIKNLMDSPENAIDIMNKFMNTPAEALRMLNQIFKGQNESDQSTNSMELKDDIKGVEGLNENLSENESVLPSKKNPDLTSPAIENTLIHSMLNYPSPSDINSAIIPPTATMSSYAPILANPLSIDSGPYVTPPHSVVGAAESINMGSPLQYHLSTALNNLTSASNLIPKEQDELPNTSSTGLLSPPSEVDAAAAAEFANEHFDIKTFIQSSFPKDSSVSFGGDSINSLESVLTEVIRIEFHAFNNLPIESRVKHERINTTMTNLSHIPDNMDNVAHYDDLNGGISPHELEGVPSAVPLTGKNMSRQLNETELMKIRELKIASEALYLPVDNDLSVLMSDDRIKPEDTNQNPKLLQVLNLTAVAIKRLIKMAKKIAGFRDMCQEDQVALLKGGCTEMMIMRSVMTFDYNRNSWKIPHTKEDMSNIRAEVLKLAKGNVYEELIKFISTFDEKWRTDEHIILIMCAIVLFSPTRPRIIHSDVIRLEQNSYYYLLRRYLESVYSGCEAKSAFIKLIQKISDVERLNEFMVGVYLNVNPSQVEPLLREIFDLKDH